jgi:hypothetical protein
LLYFMLIQQNIDRNKEIYPVCIFEGFKNRNENRTNDQ